MYHVISVGGQQRATYRWQTHAICRWRANAPPPQVAPSSAIGPVTAIVWEGNCHCHRRMAPLPSSNERRAKISRCSTSNPCLLLYLSLFVYSINILDVEFSCVFLSCDSISQHLPLSVSGSVSESVSDGFRFGDSCHISELCELVLNQNMIEGMAWWKKANNSC